MNYWIRFDFNLIVWYNVCNKEVAMKPSERFEEKFKHLTPRQAQLVLADLIVSQNNDEHYELWQDTKWAKEFPTNDGLIVLALQMALDQFYTPDKADVLEAIIESIAEDEEYFNYGE